MGALPAPCGLPSSTLRDGSLSVTGRPPAAPRRRRRDLQSALPQRADGEGGGGVCAPHRRGLPGARCASLALAPLSSRSTLRSRLHRVAAVPHSCHPHPHARSSHLTPPPPPPQVHWVMDNLPSATKYVDETNPAKPLTIYDLGFPLGALTPRRRPPWQWRGCPSTHAHRALALRMPCRLLSSRCGFVRAAWPLPHHRCVWRSLRDLTSPRLLHWCLWGCLSLRSHTTASCAMPRVSRECVCPIVRARSVCPTA